MDTVISPPPFLNTIKLTTHTKINVILKNTMDPNRQILSRDFGFSVASVMMKVLLIDNLNLKTYLADISIGASNRNICKVSFQVQVVYQENLHHFRFSLSQHI